MFPTLGKVKWATHCVDSNPLVTFHRMLRTRYALSPSMYDRMLRRQRGRCEICRKILDPPIVDHDHTKGLVRGLLCLNCNLGIGHFREDPQRILAAIDYLDSV